MFGMPNQMMPGFPMQSAPVPMRTMPPQPAQWQAAPAMPPLAHLASGVDRRPVKARGVSAEPAPAKFVMPSPEALGVKVQAASAPPAAPSAPVDWNAIQTRMERLRVLKYEKDRQASGVRVLILLPTADPTQAQPIVARAETEAAAILLALQTAEAWVQQRGK